MATLHPTTPRRTSARWLALAVELSTDAAILFLACSITYLLLAVEVQG